MRASIFFRSTISIVLSAASVTTGCGQNVLSKSVVARSLAGSLDGSQGGIPAPTLDKWQDIDTEGEMTSSPFGSHKVISIDKVAKTITLSMPLPLNPLGAMTKMDLNELPGAYVEVAQDSTGNWEMNIVVPLKYVVKGVQSVPPATLPNGKPIPAVPGGELPRIGIHVTSTHPDFYLYLSSTVFGAFIPTPGINPFVDLTFPIKNLKQTKIMGYFSTVAEVKPFAGGFFASFRVPAALSRAIDDTF